MRIGVNLRIDVAKIDKSRIFVGKKGKYLDLVAFIDTENKSEFDDNGTITQELSKEDRDNGIKLPIIGNAKVFWQDGQSKSTNKQQTRKPEQQSQKTGYQNNQSNGYDDGPDSEIPFQAMTGIETINK